jgi:hypothetical protein
VVEYSLPEIHQEASAGILTRHLLKNVRGPIIQTHQKHPFNKPNGINCWQHVFIADGIIGRGRIVVPVEITYMDTEDEY